MNLHIDVKELTKAYPLSRSESGEMLGRMLGGTGDASTDRGDYKFAVDHVNFRIEHGERVGIIGRNGAGKSTLLHMIAGLTTPSSGSVDVNGKVTAVMTLGLGLREHASGRENIYIDGEIQGKTRQEIDTVIDQIVEFAELGEFIDFPVRTYSTGMKSRLSFAMISCLEPEILIIDEALSAGDARFAKKATAKINEICSKGKIVIIVSHSIGTVMDMCDRCLWIDQGKIVMDGTPETVTKAYIDSVRGDDEARLLERFKREVGAYSAGAPWQVDILHTTHGDDEDRSVLMSGQPVAVRVQVSVGECDATTEISCIVTRLDGQMLLDRTEKAQSFVRDGKLRVVFGMESIAFGQGVYRLDVRVRHAGELKASSSKIAEVYVLNPPTGGRPMLLYPSRVSARTIS